MNKLSDYNITKAFSCFSFTKILFKNKETLHHFKIGFFVCLSWRVFLSKSLFDSYKRIQFEHMQTKHKRSSININRSVRETNRKISISLYVNNPFKKVQAAWPHNTHPWNELSPFKVFRKARLETSLNSLAWSLN